MPSGPRATSTREFATADHFNRRITAPTANALPGPPRQGTGPSPQRSIDLIPRAPPPPVWSTSHIPPHAGTAIFPTVTTSRHLHALLRLAPRERELPPTDNNAARGYAVRCTR